MTRIGSIIWASSVPPGGLTRAALCQPESSKPGSDQPGISRRASYSSPSYSLFASDRAVGGQPPVGVADHVLHRAVGVFQADLEEQLGVPVGRHRHGDVSAGGEIAAVAQDDADGVVSRMNVARSRRT